jgi:hypothetical protein
MPGIVARRRSLTYRPIRPPERRTGGFLWLHYDLANVAAEKWLLEHPDLSPALFEGQSTKDPAPRASITRMARSSRS